MNKLTICGAVLALASSVASATVTINVKTSGWGNASASANGLYWGIIVDTDTSATAGDFGGTFLTDLGFALDGFATPSVSGSGGNASGVSLFDEYQLVSARDVTTQGGPPLFSLVS